MRHPIRVLNPKEARNQRCPVFPNRAPGRQPSISHGCKVAGSTFLLKFQRRVRIAHQNWIRRGIYGFWCLRQNLIVLGATFSQAFFYFCFSQVSERLDQDEAHSPSQADQLNTCERRLLQLACRSLCIPSYRRFYLSAWQVPRQQPSRTPRTAVEEKNSAFGSPRTILFARKRNVAGWVASNFNTLDAV